MQGKGPVRERDTPGVERGDFLPVGPEEVEEVDSVSRGIEVWSERRLWGQGEREETTTPPDRDPSDSDDDRPEGSWSLPEVSCYRLPSPGKKSSSLTLPDRVGTDGIQVSGVEVRTEKTVQGYKDVYVQRVVCSTRTLVLCGSDRSDIRIVDPRPWTKDQPVLPAGGSSTFLPLQKGRTSDLRFTGESRFGTSVFS